MNPYAYVRVELTPRTVTSNPSSRTFRHLAVLAEEGEPARVEGAAPGDDGPLQVGDLAKATGKTVRAIHLYEDLGLLRPAERSKGRFRLYDRASVERVRWIAKLQTLGFSLPEIQEIVRQNVGVTEPREAAEKLRDVYVEKLRDVQSRLSELRKLERELVTSLHYLGACRSACEAEATIDACPTCERHLDQPEPPALVRGAFVHPATAKAVPPKAPNPDRP